MAYAFVGTTLSVENLAGSTATTASKTTTTNNAILAIAGWGVAGAGSLNASVTDNKSNKFAKLGEKLTVGVGDAAYQLFICQNITGGAGHTFTGTVSGANAVVLATEEISGLAKKFSVYGWAAQRQGAVGTETDRVSSGGDVIPNGVSGVLVGFGYGGVGAPNVGTGFASRGTFFPGIGTTMRIEYKSVTGDGVTPVYATFTNTGATENLSFFVFLAEDGTIDETVTQLISDSFTGSSGTNVTTYNTLWCSPNATCNLKGSNQLGAAVLSGSTEDTDAPVHRLDYRAKNIWSGITVTTMSDDYTACTTHCYGEKNSLGFGYLTHHAFGLSSGNSDIYKQINGLVTTIVDGGPGIANGDVARLYSTADGGVHYAELNGEIVMIGRDRTIATGYAGTGCVVGDSTDGVRITSFVSGAVGALEAQPTSAFAWIRA